MLPGITPAMFGGEVTDFVDGFTRGLCKFYGVGGTTTPTFTDYANPARTWVTQGTQGNVTSGGRFGAGYFSPGTTGYLLQTPFDKSFDFAGDFTIDFWWAPADITTHSGGIISKANASVAGKRSWLFNLANFNQVYFYASSDGSTWNISSGTLMVTLADTSFHHYAVVRAGSTWRLFVDGTQRATFTNANAPFFNTQPVQIGLYVDSVGTNTGAGGYFDEVRLSSTARWTAPFTTMREPYYKPLSGGNDDATKFLLHADDADLSTAFVDSATGATHSHPITVYGGAKMSTTQKKFGATSLSLTGSDRITVPNSQDFDYHANDFTVDFWYYPTAKTATHMICGKRTAGADFSSFELQDRLGVVGIYASSSGASYDLMNNVTFSSTTYTQNAWQHIALVRKSGTLSFYMNGVSKGTPQALGGIWINSSVYTIGTVAGGGAETQFYIDEFRVSDVARWTANFTPPTIPYAPYGAGPPQPATQFSVTAPASVTTGTAFNVTVQALDESGTPTTNYSGTVSITSTNGNATLPANNTLSSGARTFSVKLNAAGTFTVTATDTVTGSITGTSGNVVAATSQKTEFVSAVGSSSWQVPPTWNNSNNTIECIGGGGGGLGGTNGGNNNSGGGGGGGAYAKISNLALTPGASITCTVGSGGVAGGGFGNATWFRNGSTVYAVGGYPGTTGAGGAGNASGNVGTVIRVGGNGGNPDGSAGGGGGGAGGPNGNGGWGGGAANYGGGGGGGGGGGNGQPSPGTAGGNGGNNWQGTGAGSGGGIGSGGGSGAYGGGGGGSGSAAQGGTGGHGQEWGSNVGSAGGGGGGADGSGGTGGVFGGGGGGGGYGGPGAAGTQGIIAIRWFG